MESGELVCQVFPGLLPKDNISPYLVLFSRNGRIWVKSYCKHFCVFLPEAKHARPQNAQRMEEHWKQHRKARLSCHHGFWSSDKSVGLYNDSQLKGSVMVAWNGEEPCRVTYSWESFLENSENSSWAGQTLPGITLPSNLVFWQHSSTCQTENPR